MKLKIEIREDDYNGDEFPEILRHIAGEIEKGYFKGQGWEIIEDDDEEDE